MVLCIRIAKNNVSMLKHLSNYVPIRTLDQIYKTLIRPHLDYADVIYHIPHYQNDFTISFHPLKERIEQIQYQAAGAWPCG